MHDDATLTHVEESASYGMTIAGFPTILEAAQGCRRLGMSVLMGAPNVVRGGMHSGNSAAAGLAKEGLLDILSSDYYPASLLQAAFALADRRADLVQVWTQGRAACDSTSLAARKEGVLMAGRLIYLIGPSGSGKDSLLDAAREELATHGCRIVRRVITRSAEAVGEAAQAVSIEQFTTMQARGEFALSWQANGLHYGIPKEIDEWLAQGSDVLINGSRGYLPQVRQRYPDLLVVLLTVSDQALRQRLLARGRESLAEIEARLRRNADFAGEVQGSDAGVFVLDNSGALEHSVEQLIRRIAREHACA